MQGWGSCETCYSEDDGPVDRSLSQSAFQPLDGRLELGARNPVPQRDSPCMLGRVSPLPASSLKHRKISACERRKSTLGPDPNCVAALGAEGQDVVQTQLGRRVRTGA